MEEVEIGSKQNFVFAVLLLCAWTFIGLPAVQAGERFEFFNGIRSLGMGGAQIAIVNDETALVANPAALGRLRDRFLTYADLEAEIGTNNVGNGTLSPLTALEPDSTFDALDGHLNDPSRTSVQIFPSFVLPNFGLGVFARLQSTAEVTDTASTTGYDLQYQQDVAVVTGFNFRFFDGIFKLGFNVRAINRTEAKGTFDATGATNVDLDTIGTEGAGVATDVGTLLTFPIRYLPTFSIVARDVGNTSFDLSSGSLNSLDGTPETKDMSVDVGFAIAPILGKGTRSLFSVELRDVLYDESENGDEDLIRRLHGGLEINIEDALFLRGGMNQGYWTAGLELAFAYYQLQFAAYGEDIGDGTTAREDRRYIMKVAFRF